MKRNLLIMLLCLAPAVTSFGQSRTGDVNGIDPGIVPSLKSPEIYTFVEQAPISDFDLGGYLNKNLHVSDSSLSGAIKNRIVVQFVINEDGTVTDPKILRGGISPVTDEEILKLVLKMPKWKPGRQNGKAVKVRYSLPITICLE